KQALLMHVEKANDKIYASDHYKRVLLSENELIPRFSVYFYQLTVTFDHFRKLGEENVLDETLSFLDHIKDSTRTAINNASRYCEEKYIDSSLLHWLYVEALEQEETSILSLIDQDKKLLKCPTRKVIVLLANYRAVQELLIEFSDQPVETSETRESFDQLNTNQQQITRSQQVLITYYFIRLLGKKPHKGVSKYADALHTFLGLPYSQIRNSELYKKLLNPLTYSSAKATLINLSVVRTFFEKLDFAQALHLIDSDIETLRKSLDELS
ncbi:MAG: hypothetical protein HYZ42_16285, partial [Bacteroidetes bacterium]|nr:hypothetical protein [Bacteroidota bacterium]